MIERTGDSKLIFTYNGQYGVLTDPNGLLYMRTRFYNPNLKRFMNADILDGSIADSTTLNLYTYVNGNPISFVDPFGMEPVHGQKKYGFEYRNDINGIGLLPDGTLLYGRNVTDSDALVLVSMDIKTEKGVSADELLELIELYLSDPDHKDSTIISGKGLNYYTNLEDISQSLTNEMIRAEYEYTMIYQDGKLIGYDDVPGLWMSLLSEFKHLVQNGGDWDLKQKSEWQQSSLYYFNGELVDRDAPGNIMYGYMGKAYGIPDTILYAAAGYAQLSAGTSKIEFLNTYGDDPIDQMNIKRGIDYYNSLHGVK